MLTVWLRSEKGGGGGGGWLPCCMPPMLEWMPTLPPWCTEWAEWAVRVVRGTGEGQDEGRSRAVRGELQPPAPLPPPGAEVAGAADDHFGDDSSLPTAGERGG